jgi:ABC-2 type transport system ATP-binding protein
VIDEQRAFWSKVASRYDRVVDRQIGGRTRAMVRDRVERESGLGRLVEFGCGTGYYTRILAQRADAVVATDLSPGMLALAEEQVGAPNVRFQTEDCQRTSFPDASFDTAFVSLVIHFTEPERTLAEMRRILRPGGTLVLSNLDPRALKGLDRLRCRMRVLFHGIAGYRTRPPTRFGKNVLSEEMLSDLLRRTGFLVRAVERIRDTARSSNIPVEYVKAVKT